MRKSFRLPGLLILMAAAVAGSASTGKKSDNPIIKEGSRMATLLANNLPLMHLNKIPWDDQIAQRGFDNFIETLDFEKVFFLAEDIERFRAQVPKLDDLIKRGDLTFPQQVYAVFRERVTNRVAYAEQLLNQPFDFTTDEDYAWKRKDASWATGPQEWDDLWRRRIKHLYLSRMINAETGDSDEVIEEEEDRKSHSEKIDATLSPEEFVRKSLRQYKMMIEDNDETWILERYLTSFARAFDPHTDFMSPNSMEDFEINMKLSLQGIGAILSSEEGAAKVERLIPGGPAEQDGRLKPGDKIIAVAQGDDQPVDVLHWPLYKTVRLIRGDKGTKVVLTVIPASDSSGSTLSKIDITRDEVKLEEQAAKGEMRTTPQSNGESLPIGVITLPDFYSDFKGGNGEESTS